MSTERNGSFYTIYGNGPTGLLAAWAWGVRRYIDVIEASDSGVIDAQGLAVMGCSRLGKAAFAIGARAGGGVGNLGPPLHCSSRN